MKKILVLDTHPSANSFGASLAQEYAVSAEESGAEVEIVSLRDLSIDWCRDPRGYPVELEVARLQSMIQEAKHIVVVFPVYWGLYPAILKGFIDRVLLPGFAYEYAEGSHALPRKLLAGRTARLIYTMDSPGWFHRFVYGAPAEKALMRATLWFVGIKTVGRNVLTVTRSTTLPRREAFIKEVREGAVGDAKKVKGPNRVGSALKA
ncbi:MAG: NAD(P)H-dependent oxidoreductase [Armatimonadetes bacterium]|nr:NAD(P)H-dependent oxidoreductase [Armatimonadota bacterium]